MNTVKHFVKISTQKLEIIQRKVANRIDCCLPLCHFYLEKSVSYPMITNVHVSVRCEENENCYTEAGAVGPIFGPD